MNAKAETLAPADQLARESPIRIRNESAAYRAARQALLAQRRAAVGGCLRASVRAVLAAAFCLACGAASADEALQWRPGLSADALRHAKIIRIAPGFRTSDLAQLGDDQTLELPDGKHILVRELRAIEQAIARAQARPRPPPFPVLAAPTRPCSPIRAGETPEQILARPASDVVCIDGKGVTIAQLRAIKSYADRMYATVAKAMLSGKATLVSTRAQLIRLLNAPPDTAPDSMVLVTPAGKRILLGELRAVVRAHMPTLAPSSKAGGGQ